MKKVYEELLKDLQNLRKEDDYVVIGSTGRELSKKYRSLLVEDDLCDLCSDLHALYDLSYVSQQQDNLDRLIKVVSICLNNLGSLTDEEKNIFKHIRESLVIKEFDANLLTNTKNTEFNNKMAEIVEKLDDINKLMKQASSHLDD